jgi:hypothetical protein
MYIESTLDYFLTVAYVSNLHTKFRNHFILFFIMINVRNLDPDIKNYFKLLFIMGYECNLMQFMVTLSYIS